jgi:hypothetical protein
VLLVEIECLADMVSICLLTRTWSMSDTPGRAYPVFANQAMCGHYFSTRQFDGLAN